MLRRWLTISLSFVALTFLAGGATAAPMDPTAIAIVSLDVRGDAAPELSAQVQASIGIGLKQAGLRAIPNRDVMRAIGKRRQLINCSSSMCLGQLSLLVGANRFLRGRVEASGAAYKVELELLDVTGNVQNSVSESCAVCTVTELSRIVKKRAVELVSTRPSKPVTIVITSRPEGAKVHVDGRSIGVTPYEGEVLPGKRRVTAILPGYGEWEKTIEIRAGQSQPQRFEMVLVRLTDAKHGTGDTHAATHPRPYRHLKWLSGGAAVASLVTGIVLLSVDGKGTCGASPPEQCPELRDTKLIGVVTVVLGLGLGGASGWMFKRDRRDARTPRATISPRRGGAVGSIFLRF